MDVDGCNGKYIKDRSDLSLPAKFVSQAWATTVTPTLPTQGQWGRVDDRHGPKDSEDSTRGFQHPTFVGSRPPR